MNTKRGEFEFLNPLQAILLSFGNKVWVNTKNNLGAALIWLNIVISKSVLNISVVVSPKCGFSLQGLIRGGLANSSVFVEI